MLVRNRDHSLTYRRAIKRDKIDVILVWLLEFRFSSFEILAQRLDLRLISCMKFFTDLVKDGILQEFKNVHTRGTRYLMLSSTSVSYLQADGYDVSKAATDPSKLGRYSTIVHDLAVQKSAIEVAEKFNSREIIWDRHIKAKGQRPDLLFESSGHWAALEFERWRKTDGEIFRLFKNHAEAIAEKKYDAVFLYFETDVDMKYYQDRFRKDTWPIYVKKNNRTWVLSEKKFSKKNIPEIDDRFRFVHFPSNV